MAFVLRAAAVYNVVWGGAVVLLPQQTANLAGFAPPPRYPELWQCAGMMVAVWGVGYALAARDPFRHWPIALVGLLGKVFGPLGFAWSLWRGGLPVRMGWVILGSDLIWWAPFCCILWAAARSESEVVPSDGPPASQTLRDQYGRTLAELWTGRTILLVFLRHAGCTFFREAIADISGLRERLQQAGIDPVFVHPADESLEKLFAAYGMADVSRIRDPERQLYAEFSLPTGSFRQLLGWRTLFRGARSALVSRHGFGRFRGNGLQMPGVFVMRDGVVQAEYRHQSASDRPDYARLCGLEASQPVA